MNMYRISTHPQVQYTLPMLTKWLFYHLQSRPIDKITIEQICQQAELSRRTFYRNCECKEDLVLYACDLLLEQLLSSVDFTSTHARAMYQNFFRFWYEHRMFLRALYQGNLFPLFAARFIESCDPQTRFPLQQYALRNHRQPEAAMRFSNAFILGGLVNMLLSWSAEDFKSSPEDLAASLLFLLPKEYRR